MERYYDFVTDIRCYMANGEKALLKDYEVCVFAYDLQDAEDGVEQVASDMIHDAGSDLLDAPLDYIEILRCKHVKHEWQDEES